MVYLLKPVSKETDHILELARDEARLHQHPYIGPEHLLLILLRENTGQVSAILTQLGVNEKTLFPEVEALVNVDIPVRIRAKRYVPTIIKFLRLFIKPRYRLTQRAKRVIDLAYEEALRIGHTRIEPENLLFGIVHENDGPAGQLLHSKGIDAEQLHEEIEKIVK